MIVDVGPASADWPIEKGSWRMADPLERFTSVLRGVLGDRITPEASTLFEMFAEDGVMEFPFAPPGRPSRVVGRQALSAYLGSLVGMIEFDRFTDPVVHYLRDPATVILEFESFGRVAGSDAPFQQRYVSIVRTQGGHIVNYRDYWDPLAILKAVRGPVAVEALFRP